MIDAHEPDQEGPSYAAPADIDPRGLFNSLAKLTLIRRDTFLRMQGFNLGIVDRWLNDLEYSVLRDLNETEKTPPEAAFLSAQSQMWIFAAYELIRTWKSRSKEIIRLEESGGLEQKLHSLESKKMGYLHFGLEQRIRQLKDAIAIPEYSEVLNRELRHVEIPFVRLEHLRIAMAKHEVRRSERAALMPGYGRINSWCGSLDYEIENGKFSLGLISRRDIADSFRGLDLTSEPPTEETLKEFEDYMRGTGYDSDEIFADVQVVFEDSIE